MWELVAASIIPTIAIIGSMLYLRKYVPNMIQLALNDIGQQISEQFTNPTIKKAYTILGKKSGEARASEGLRNKVADKVLEGSPVLSRIIEELDIEPMEGLQLLNDPILRPFVAKFLQGGLGGGVTHNPEQTPRGVM